MLHFIIAALIALPQPKADAPCFDAPLRIGTDNVPISNTIPTSVANIWAFRGPEQASLGWLFKNVRGDYYISMARAADHFPHPQWAARYFMYPNSSSSGAAFSKVTYQEIVTLENWLLSTGITRVACFAHDFKMPT